jgi:hypothetical protein
MKELEKNSVYQVSRNILVYIYEYDVCVCYMIRMKKSG